MLLSGILKYSYSSTLGAKNYVSDAGFRNALYVIDIGQNDIADSFIKNLSYAQVVKRIPAVVIEIETAIKVSPMTCNIIE